MTAYYGLHSAHGRFPARIASSLLANRWRFLTEILAADFRKTSEFFDAT